MRRNPLLGRVLTVQIVDRHAARYCRALHPGSSLNAEGHLLPERHNRQPLAKESVADFVDFLGALFHCRPRSICPDQQIECAQKPIHLEMIILAITSI
jgi:hypothetical protein